MIDLHTHTTESDGTLTADALVSAAAAAGLEALAITDHDTFAGYDKAVRPAQAAGVELLCGIEISTAWGEPKEQTVHLLGYWFHSAPPGAFRSWLRGIQAARKDRNIRLAAKLQSLGLDIRLEDAEALGRNMTGRPHFARLMLAKGYVRSIQEAFDRYLDESAAAYVWRDEPSFAEAVQRVNESGGLASLAHPTRLDKTGEEEARTIATMVDMGLPAIEVWHSDHTPTDALRYYQYANRFGLHATGGSDFHGDVKPSVKLGRGLDNLNIPYAVLDTLRGSRTQAIR